VVTDPLIAKYFFRTLVWNFAFAALTVAGTFALGLLVAIVLNHERLKGQRIYRSLLILPYAMPAFAMLLLWRDMFNTDFGLINRLFGTEVNWFGKPVTAMIAVLLVQLWMGYPYMFLVATGALQSIPGDLKEAASVDGAKAHLRLPHDRLPAAAGRAGAADDRLVRLQLQQLQRHLHGLGGRAVPARQPPDRRHRPADHLHLPAGLRRPGGPVRVRGRRLGVFIFLIVAVFSIIGFRRTRALEEVN